MLFICINFFIYFFFYYYIFKYFCCSCLINCLTFSKKCNKSISFEVIDSLLLKLAIVSFYISCSSTSILSRFSFANFLRFFSSFSFSISRFSSSFVFSLFSSSCFCISFFLFLLGLTFSCMLKKKWKFFYNLHILWFEICARLFHYTLLVRLMFF